MLVKNIMISVDKLTTVPMSFTVEETINLIDSKNLLSLPVVHGKKFIGVISKKYIFEEFFDRGGDKEEFLKLPIADFMKTSIESVRRGDIVEVAVEMLREKNRQFIPVVSSKDEFVGIVTHKAVFKTMTDILGFGYTRMVITTHEMKGRLAKLSEIIYKHDANIISIIELNVAVMDLRQILLRVDAKDIKALTKEIEDNGFRVRSVD